MIKFILIILIILICLLILNFSVNYKKNLLFSSTQKEGKNFLIYRQNINNKYNGISLKEIADYIDILYHSKNKKFNTCSYEDYLYLINKKKKYYYNFKSCLKESKLTHSQLVNLFTENKNEYNYLLKLKKEILLPIVYYLKNKYNRVRPEFCFKNLRNEHSKKNIELPNHASYPSGHASSVYFLYEMTKNNSILEKKNKDLAKKISENREIAGLHYKDDTNFGKFIGEQLVIILKNN